MHIPQFGRPSAAYTYTPPHLPIDAPAPGNRRDRRRPNRRRERRGLPQREMVLGSAPKVAEILERDTTTTPKVVCASNEVTALVLSCHALLQENRFEQDHRLVRLVPAIVLAAIEGRELTPRQARRIAALVNSAWEDPTRIPAAVAIERILGMLRIVDDGRVEALISRAVETARNESRQARSHTALRV